MINKAVKLITCHYRLDIESALVKVSKCSIEKFQEGLALYIEDSIDSGEVQVPGNGGKERNSVDEEDIHPEADVLVIVKDFIRDWYDFFPYMFS